MVLRLVATPCDGVQIWSMLGLPEGLLDPGMCFLVHLLNSFLNKFVKSGNRGINAGLANHGHHGMWSVQLARTTSIHSPATLWLALTGVCYCWLAQPVHGKFALFRHVLCLLYRAQCCISINCQLESDSVTRGWIGLGTRHSGVCQQQVAAYMHACFASFLAVPLQKVPSSLRFGPAAMCTNMCLLNAVCPLCLASSRCVKCLMLHQDKLFHAWAPLRVVGMWVFTGL